MSNPTLQAALTPRVWLEWLGEPRDGPVLVLLALVLVLLGLGLWSRRGRG